jgi:uncharacterized protein
MPRQVIGSLFSGWSGLAWFWVCMVVLLAIAGATLQILGPLPHEQPARPVAQARPPLPRPQPAAPAPAPVAEKASLTPQPGRSTPGPIADPDPALLEPMTGSTTNLLPRIAADGRMAMQVYAAGYDDSSRRPRVGLLLAGIGMSQSDSEAAIHSLPGGITLAFSPYARSPEKLLADARLAEHEYLLSIPMEPQGFPLNDPGPQALMTSVSPEQNHVRLDWALSRIRGYAGATGALGDGLLGERFASLADELQPVLAELAHRGLFYVDPTPSSAPSPLVWSRGVDVVIDTPEDLATIDDRLTQLSLLAHARGSALGLATAPKPFTVERIAAWAGGLTADGLALAPVSALVKPPAKGTAP